MATIKEQEELMEVLKFTPRTYKIRLWGYGGEYVMGEVDRKIYDYFKRRRLDLSEYAWDSEYAEANNIPEDMQPFYPGQWHDGDNMGHCWGVDRSAGTLQVEDENGEVIYEKALEDISGWGEDDENPEPEWHGGDEIWIDMKDPGTVVYIGVSSEKGTFFEGDLELKAPFNPGKIALCYDEIDGNEIITSIVYNGEIVENWGGDTNGKGSDHAFYIAGSNKDTGSWERYRNMDDINYTMTDWFPKKIKPVREGVYNIRTAGKNSYTHHAKWTGEKWTSMWNDEDEIKIKEWQGIAYNPDEQDLRDELDTIVAESAHLSMAEKLEIIAENKAEIAAEQAAGAKWPFATGADTTLNEVTVEEEIKSKWWTVKTYHKKNCEQQEYFIQRDGDGRIKVTDGFRWCEYRVETNDGEFPQFEFTQVPGGNAAKDSLDLNSLYGTNIENSELVSMDDGGCWGGWEIEGVSEEEEEKLNEFLEENGSWALEDDGKWYLDETEVWVWGPLEVSDDDGNTRIIIADADGNVTDFVE